MPPALSTPTPAPAQHARLGPTPRSVPACPGVSPVLTQCDIAHCGVYTSSKLQTAAWHPGGTVPSHDTQQYLHGAQRQARHHLHNVPQPHHCCTQQHQGTVAQGLHHYLGHALSGILACICVPASSCLCASNLLCVPLACSLVPCRLHWPSSHTRQRCCVCWLQHHHRQLVFYNLQARVHRQPCCPVQLGNLGQQRRLLRWGWRSRRCQLRPPPPPTTSTYVFRDCVSFSNGKLCRTTVRPTLPVCLGPCDAGINPACCYAAEASEPLRRAVHSMVEHWHLVNCSLMCALAGCASQQ